MAKGKIGWKASKLNNKLGYWEAKRAALCLDYYDANAKYQEKLNLCHRVSSTWYGTREEDFIEDYGRYLYPDCYGYKEEANWWFNEKERLAGEIKQLDNLLSELFKLRLTMLDDEICIY